MPQSAILHFGVAQLNATPHTQGWTARQKSVLTIVLGSYLMLLLDTSIVITGLPMIRTAFDLSPVALSWVSSAYLLGFGGFLLLGARAGDLYGRKRVFLTGLVLFTVASAGIGLAPSGLALIVARFIQGLGAAILAPSTLALLQMSFAEGQERTQALSAYAATAGIGSSAGLVLGGVLAGLASWRIGFLINVPAGIFLFWLANRLLTETDRAGGRLDIPGAFASTLGSAALVYGISEMGESGKASLMALGMMALGLIILLVFIRMQVGQTQPLLPLRLLHSAVRSGAYLARFMFTAAMMGFFFLTTQTMQGHMGMSPQLAGIGFLPMTIMTFVASLLVPRLTRRMGNGGVAALAFLLIAIGLVWLSVTNLHLGYALALGLPLLILGLGNGLGLGPLTQAGVQGAMPQDAGAAAGLVNTMHQLGGSVGVAATAAVAAAAGLPAGFVCAAVAGVLGFIFSVLFVSQRSTYSLK